MSLDSRFAPHVVGGWHIAKARDLRVNDNFTAYAVRAASEDFRVDATEVSEARWFPLQALLDSYKSAGSPHPLEQRTLEGGSHSLLDELPEERRRISVNALAWLTNYSAGGGLRARVHAAGGAAGTGAGQAVFYGGPPMPN